MSKILFKDQCIKIKQINYGQGEKSARTTRSGSLGRNPIKVVMDMIGQDGEIIQKIVSQPQSCTIKSKPFEFKVSKSLSKKQFEHKAYQTMRPTSPKPPIARSFVFNRFNYDHHKDFPIPKTLQSSSKKTPRTNSGHKNIQIVFCENKLPDFVQKTNEKIENLYKQEQAREQKALYKSILKNSTAFNKVSEDFTQPKKSYKTNLANCLKEYATLQKLSMFMQNDQRRRQTCICYEVEKDPSRNLLLDIITHRFKFLKTMNKRSRDQLYRSLLGRQINALTKINIQEYMKISQMFVGRDAGKYQVATFMYIFLFGEKSPTFEMARQKLELINGQKYKLNALLQELYKFFSTVTVDYLVDILAERDKILRMFIDYIVERQ